MSTGEA